MKYTHKIWLANNNFDPITGTSFNGGLGYHPYRISGGMVLPHGTQKIMGGIFNEQEQVINDEIAELEGQIDEETVENLEQQIRNVEDERDQHITREKLTRPDLSKIVRGFNTEIKGFEAQIIKLKSQLQEIETNQESLNEISDRKDEIIKDAQVPELILKYEPEIEKYATKSGIDMDELRRTSSIDEIREMIAEKTNKIELGIHPGEKMILSKQIEFLNSLVDFLNTKREENIIPGVTPDWMRNPKQRVSKIFSQSHLGAIKEVGKEMTKRRQFKWDEEDIRFERGNLNEININKGGGESDEEEANDIEQAVNKIMKVKPLSNWKLTNRLIRIEGNAANPHVDQQYLNDQFKELVQDYSGNSGLTTSLIQTMKHFNLDVISDDVIYELKSYNETLYDYLQTTHNDMFMNEINDEIKNTKSDKELSLVEKNKRIDTLHKDLYEYITETKSDAGYIRLGENKFSGEKNRELRQIYKKIGGKYYIYNVMYRYSKKSNEIPVFTEKPRKFGVVISLSDVTLVWDVTEDTTIPYRLLKKGEFGYDENDKRYTVDIVEMVQRNQFSPIRNEKKNNIEFKIPLNKFKILYT